jgi:hypothetical protein
MNTQDLNADDFNELFSQTVQAMIKLNHDAMSNVISKTDEAFGMFCMLESMSRLSAAMLSQTVEPEKAILQFAEEIRQKIALVNQPIGTIQ